MEFDSYTKKERKEKMEKKVKFSENKNLAKTVYGVLIAVLCITAIIIGIVASNNRPVDPVPDEPVIGGNDNGDDSTPGDETPGEDQKPEEKPTKLEFISPVAGKVEKMHDLTTPVFSTTLEEWRVHSGIDIMTEENAEVFAAERGEITRVYTNALLGHCVEITHEGDIKTVYANLNPNSQHTVKVGDSVEKGQAIGTVGDSSISELAEEPHLHLEFVVGQDKVNPLDYISEEAQSASLGIEN